MSKWKELSVSHAHDLRLLLSLLKLEPANKCIYVHFCSNFFFSLFICGIVIWVVFGTYGVVFFWCELENLRRFAWFCLFLYLFLIYFSSQSSLKKPLVNEVLSRFWSKLGVLHVFIWYWYTATLCILFEHIPKVSRKIRYVWP